MVNYRNNRSLFDFNYLQAAGSGLGGALARGSALLRGISGKALDVAEGIGVGFGAKTLGSFELK